MTPSNGRPDLDELTDSYSAAVSGDGRVVLVEGPIGCGRTSLLHGLSRHVTDSGGRTLSATASFVEREIPLGVIHQLFDGSPPSGKDDHEVFRTVLNTLLELAERQPLAVTVDDLNYADEASLRAILYLQRRIRSARVLLVLAHAGEPATGLVGIYTDLARQPHCRRIRLGPLPAEDVEPALFADTGGNPLLLGAASDDHAFHQAVQVCLHRGDLTLLWTARALAALGERATPHAVARLLTPTRVSAALAELAAAGLTEHGRLRPRIADVVLADMTRGDATALLGRAARLLYEDGAPSSDVARALLAAGYLPDLPPWTVTVLSEAADTALAANRVDRAVEYLELARGITVDEADRTALTAALLRVQWRSGPSAVRQHLRPLRAAFDRGHLAEADARLLVHALLWHGRGAEAVPVLQRLLPPGEGASHSRRTTREWLGCWYPEALSLVPKALIGPTQPAGSGTSRMTAATAEQVLQHCTPSADDPEAALVALGTLMHANKLDRAEFWCDELFAATRPRGFVTWRAALTDIRSGLALRRGDLAGAHRHAVTALESMSEDSWGVAIGSPLSHIVRAATAMGDLDEAARYLDRPVPTAMFDTAFSLVYLRARGYHHLATDRPHAALADFHTVRDLVTAWNLDSGVRTSWRSDAAQAYLRMERPDQARRLAEDQLMTGRLDPHTHGVCLRVLASASDIKRRPPMLRKAIDLLQDSGDNYELALTLAEYSQTDHLLGDLKRSRMTARQAAQLAQSCHAAPLAARLLPADQPSTSDSSPAVALLTETEHRVAVLAASGHTNREIARKLHITVSTVEQHLTKIYRKLNVHRRADLPAEL